MHPVSFPAFVAAFALLAAPAFAARDNNVPRLNIEGTCREAQNVTSGNDKVSGKQTYDACIQDEREARTQLSNKWSSFKPADRRSCVEGSREPSPSYVELLTCLEMSEQVRSPASSPRDAAPNTPVTRPMGSPSARPPGSPSGGSRL